jgi:catechol 2,3-dioxygenase-like lactoylglutathione lyase family enzyme
MFKETHPILGTLDIQRAIAFYTQQLGFKLAFGDKADPPNYVGFRRDAVELHMQFQFEHEMGKPRRHKKNPKTTYALGALNREVRVLPAPPRSLTQMEISLLARSGNTNMASTYLRVRFDRSMADLYLAFG